MSAACVWSQDGADEYDTCWSTDCDNAFQLNEGGPEENGMKFCPYCGRSLVAKPYEEEGEE